ncbi:hypothetical protein HY991_03040 [Candidatus Micrarchaeota archaeon]|nr:hypothetical protein [Candidatus Micrarchaeota archaeon]
MNRTRQKKVGNRFVVRLEEYGNKARLILFALHLSGVIPITSISLGLSEAHSLYANLNTVFDIKLNFPIQF